MRRRDLIQKECPKGDCEAGRELGSVEELPKGANYEVRVE